MSGAVFSFQSLFRELASKAGKILHRALNERKAKLASGLLRLFLRWRKLLALWLLFIINIATITGHLGKLAKVMHV